MEVLSPMFTLSNKKDIQIGDIIVARYTKSSWAGPDRIFWEEWHHAGIVTKVDPLTIIEAVGHNTIGQPEGPCEVLFDESAGFGKREQPEIVKMAWLHPIFPNPIREIDAFIVPQSKRKVISENEARKRVVEYARKQIGEPYSAKVTKWHENKWYCSLLVYKSFTKTITNMYIETFPAGPFVTPEDLVESGRSQLYYLWTKQNTDNLNNHENIA